MALNLFSLPQAFGSNSMMPGYQQDPLGGMGAAPAMQTSPGFERKPIGLPGLLGIKGGFRDALGAIGDALLTAHGQKPMYAMQKREQDIAEASQDFATNPMEAIKRVSAIDPAAGAQMAENYADRQKAQQESNKRLLDVRGKVLGNVSGLMYGANPATYPALRERALAFGQRFGEDLSNDLPEAYSEDAINRLVQMGMDLDKTIDNERADMNTESMIEARENMMRNRDRNTESMIGSRASRDADSRARVAQGAARVAQGDRRTAAYESRVRSQNANQGKSGGKRGGGRGNTSGVPKAPGIYQSGSIKVRRNADGSLTRL